MESAVVEFLLVLAYTQLECGRPRDAAILLNAVAVVEPNRSDVLPLLALAQMNSGQATNAIETLDRHDAQRVGSAKQRQLTWIRIRALHLAGRKTESRHLMDQLRLELTHTS